MFARILQSFGRPMSMGQVRDSVIGIVPEEKWASWWTAARKNPQIVVSGTGAKATYSWNASAEGAEATVRRDFERADPKTKLELAKKHSSRNKELADYFSTALAAEAARLSRTDAAMAWQILSTLETLPGEYNATIEPSSLLSGAMASRTVAAINDKPLREKALGVVRRHASRLDEGLRRSVLPRRRAAHPHADHHRARGGGADRDPRSP